MFSSSEKTNEQKLHEERRNKNKKRRIRNRLGAYNAFVAAGNIVAADRQGNRLRAIGYYP